uniref:Type III-B CRISPR module RAMP protein Cmr4 n=1 Tax=candidate division WOR-3 bacterium TaxID=2052148 RepID=A0A7C4W924_UNCW3
MFKENLILTFYGLTPIHMGSGVSVSYVDNPIQREKHTDFPILAASGIKGVIRDLAERIWQDKDKVNIIFGPAPEEGGEEYASCISFTDAKILLYPVRSVRGVFAYVTCPSVLKRFKEELKSIKKDNLPNNIPDIKEESKIIISSNSELKIDSDKVALEEFVFNIDTSQNVDRLVDTLSTYLPLEIDNLKKHLAIVYDDVFRDFVKYAVEIRTRIRIDQTTGTAAEGALFTIELIPAESVFYGFLFIADPYNKSIEEINSAEKVKKELENLFSKANIIQFGGDETLGMGLMKVKIG